MNNKIVIFIIVLAVLAGGVLYMQTAKPSLVPAIENAPTGQTAEETGVPVATGKADDILASLGGEDEQDAEIIRNADADAETVLSDEGVISELNQSYDETTL